ncbi:MAG: hypothetical protein AB1487_07495 [Thermodesulfobacteriota bacterium]
MPEGWEKKIVGEVSSLISRGITPEYDNEAEGIVILDMVKESAASLSDLLRNPAILKKILNQEQLGAFFMLEGKIHQIWDSLKTSGSNYYQ